MYWYSFIFFDIFLFWDVKFFIFGDWVWVGSIFFFNGYILVGVVWSLLF